MTPDPEDLSNLSLEAIAKKSMTPEEAAFFDHADAQAVLQEITREDRSRRERRKSSEGADSDASSD